MLSSNVRPVGALALQPIDFGATFQSDWDFHVPLFIADTSGSFTRSGELTARSFSGAAWLADGSFRFVGRGSGPIP